MASVQTIREVSNPKNGADEILSYSEPYRVRVTIEGTADIFWHRWVPEEIDDKNAAAKGSKAKKTDNVQSYVWRNDEGMLSLPGEYLRQSIINAAKYRQDPRSPRKSAMDLYKAGIVCLTELGSLGKTKWDYEDRRRVNIQRQGINRTRPAIKAGWSASFEFAVLLPEYISSQALHGVLIDAGRLVGVGDFRPTYGRFHVNSFENL